MKIILPLKKNANNMVILNWNQGEIELESRSSCDL